MASLRESRGDGSIICFRYRNRRYNRRILGEAANLPLLGTGDLQRYIDKVSAMKVLVATQPALFLYKVREGRTHGETL